ncbi:unnamed protein product [Auanema sp. JU1783]|nr:unnamed protein product [Auanema sp. JU1783]
MEDMEVDASPPPFELSRVIRAHKSDVRCLTVNASNVLISGGRDNTVKFWSKKGGEYNETISYSQPSVVTSVAYYEADGDWKLFVGRRDGLVAVYGSGSKDPLHVLSYHTANVSCLYVDQKKKTLLSGSWDNNVVIWSIPFLGSDEAVRYVLKGHTLSIWALCTLPDESGCCLTASADKTIKLWNGEEAVQTFQGHTDVVRALLLVNESQFISAANDSKIRLWSIETSSCLAVFSSLVDEFIFSLTMVGPFVISCGEGGAIEVWQTELKENVMNMSHKQLIRTPAVTAWSSVGLSNGDFAVAASDGRVYVYTNSEARRAKPEVLEELDSELAARVAAQMERQERSTSDVVTIKVALDDGAANMELNYKKNTDPVVAAENFLKQYNLPISYLTEITDYICANIPEARQFQAKKMKPQETQRVEFEGEKYDSALEITLESGQKTTLAYNYDDDPDYTAQKFCEKYNLPIKFIGQIASLVRRDKTGQGKTSGQGYEDPFTGGGRYCPQSNSEESSSTFLDPFTGGGRYIPSDASDSVSNSGDPYTSDGRYVPGSSNEGAMPIASMAKRDKKKPMGELVPISVFFSFGVEQLSQKAIIKLRETNDKQDQYRLNEDQMGELERLMGAKSGSIEIKPSLTTALDTALLWSIEDIAPVCDLFRVALLHENLNSLFCDLNGRGRNILERLTSILISDPSDAVKIFICRALANAFAHAKGELLLQQDIGGLIPIVASQLTSQREPLQIAAVSALANWSFSMLKQSATVSELGPREDVLRHLIKVLEAFPSFGGYSQQALIRLLQTIVTLMWGDSEVISLAKSRSIVSIVNKIKDAVTDERGKHISRDIVEMTYAV